MASIITATLNTVLPSTTWETYTFDFATVTVTKSGFPSVDPNVLPDYFHYDDFPLPPFSYMPSRAAGYVIGAMFIALMLMLAFVSVRGQTHVYFGGVLACALFTASFMLRGAISSHPGDYNVLYWSSNILDGIGACLLTVVNYVIAATWIENVASNKGVSMGLMGFSLLYAIVVIIIHPIGATRAFKLESDTRQQSQELLTASYSMTLVMNFILCMLTIFYALADTAREFAAHITNIIAPTLLIIVWASYHLAAVNTSPSNITNTSEVMFYLMVALPLGLICILWVIFNAPRIFNFEEKYSYSAYTRRYGHKHPPKIYHAGDPCPDDPNRHNHHHHHNKEEESETACDHSHSDYHHHHHHEEEQQHHHHHHAHEEQHYGHHHHNDVTVNVSVGNEHNIERAMQRYM